MEADDPRKPTFTHIFNTIMQFCTCTIQPITYRDNMYMYMYINDLGKQGMQSKSQNFIELIDIHILEVYSVK